MPGPRNSKSKKKTQAKRHKKEKRTREAELAAAPEPAQPLRSPPPASPPSELTQLPPLPPSPPYPPDDHDDLAHLSVSHPPSLPRSPPCRDFTPPPIPPRIPAEIQTYFDNLPQIPSYLQKPCVEDLGDGPRVRDMPAFLHSRISAPPSREDPLCAEFGQEEVLEMLCTVLPEETAMIVWYNKSRLRSRVCPACKRLYHLGAAPSEPLLPEHDLDDAKQQADKYVESTRQYREQRISGICSALCFILVAHKYPAAIRSTWGRMAEELSDEIWGELDAPGDDSMGLSMMLKMTRCHDLGLSQLFFAQDDAPSESDGSDYGDGVVEPQKS